MRVNNSIKHPSLSLAPGYLLWVLDPAKNCLPENNYQKVIIKN